MDRSKDRSEQGDEVKRFEPGAPVWDRFTGAGPWVLEHATSMQAKALIVHADGTKEHYRTVIEKAWALEKPSGLEIVPEARLTRQAPQRASKDDLFALALIVGTILLIGPVATLVLRLASS